MGLGGAMPLFLHKGSDDMIFQVNNNIWRLEFCRPNSPNLLRSNGTRTVGVSDNSVKTVWIADNLSDYMRERVLCHELTHCICFEYDISLPIDLEEWLCNFMADHGREIIDLLDSLLSAIMYMVA